MGIYVMCFGEAPRGLPPAKLGARLIESAKQWARRNGLAELFHATPPDGDRVWLSFYSTSEGLAFGIEKSRIEFNAKTSIAGPGFHAALIDLCDHIEGDLGMRWRWDVGGDDTGYALHRDFQRLRMDFADQFQAYCESYGEISTLGNSLSLNQYDGLWMDDHKGVATPMGILPIEFFLEAIEEPEESEANARRVFPWWNREPDGAFWENALRVLLWTETEWRAPRTSWESHVHEVVRRLAGRGILAREPSIRSAVAELKMLIADDDLFTPPAPEGIGYRRRTRAFFLTEDWRINLPGYYIAELENEGNTVCLWFGREEIRADSYVLQAKEDKADRPWTEPFLNSLDHVKGQWIYRLAPAAEPSAEHAGYFFGSAGFQAVGEDGNIHMLVLTLFDANPNLLSRLEFIASKVWYDGERKLPRNSRGS